MVASMHLADVGPRAAMQALRSQLRAVSAPGLRYAETMVGTPLGGNLVPRPHFGRIGLIAAWEDDDALDRFLGEHPLAARLSGGWHVRLQPVRAVGSWSKLAWVPGGELAVADDEPVAVLTLAHTRLRRALPFLRASARAEQQAVADPALLAGTALARPPRLVATFSLWRTPAAMRAYVEGAAGQGHIGAIRAHGAEPFHHESVFVRFRPYASHGAWNGRDPLAAQAPADQALSSVSA